MSTQPSTILTLGELRALTRDLPDDTRLYYHAYYKGCCLSNYQTDDVWLYPKDGAPIKGIVLNPADDWDGRAARKTETDDDRS